MTTRRPPALRFKDCALTILSLGRSAHNLRELRDWIAEVPAQSIAHHCSESLLRPTFDDPEYRNDFALWARRHLHDNVLAERLGGIDLPGTGDIEMVRQQIHDIIEDRLAEVPYVPSVQPGHEFFFLRSQRVTLETGIEAATPAELAVRVPHLPAGSVFVHFVDARLRPPLLQDDFSVWLQGWGPEYDVYRERLAGIDFQLWSLMELRLRLGRALKDLAEKEKPR